MQATEEVMRRASQQYLILKTKEEELAGNVKAGALAKMTLRW